ncbi:MAG: uracil-DNA glycosylase [Candidatus Thorarchaeota archaeon]
MTREKALQVIHSEIASCTNCPLHASRINPVPGEGSADAKIMFVGEAPGAQEDKTGRPFVGRSGEILRELIREIGLSEHEVFITSVLKSRPPNNRTPRKDEVDACIGYLDRQIEVIDPRVIVLLGGVAISSVIGPWRLNEAHGKFYEAKGRTYFMTYHPAAALRFPETKEVMREDFQKLLAELSGG